MRRYVVAMLLAILVGLGIAYSQDDQTAPPKREPMPRMGRMENIEKLKLTNEQKEQMKNIRFETEKKDIGLRSALALSRLELGRLFMSESPDKAAIEKAMNDVAANEAALKMNKVNGWFEANKKLTPEQQKTWRQFLRREVMKAGAHERRGTMREPEHP